MTQFRRKDARHYLIFDFPPGSGTGIQYVAGRVQPYIVWNATYIEEYCETLDKAYAVLQDVLDGNRVGEDYEEPEEDDDLDF